MLHPVERKVTAELEQQFLDAMVVRTQQVLEMFQSKGKSYDQALPVWHRLPFGLISFIDEMCRKTGRLVSLSSKTPWVLRGDDGIEGSLMDLVTYGLMALSWTDIGGEEDGQSVVAFGHKTHEEPTIMKAPAPSSGPAPAVRVRVDPHFLRDTVYTAPGGDGARVEITGFGEVRS